MRLPRALLQHDVDLAPLAGADADGPLYGPAARRRCYREDGTRSVRTDTGRTTESVTRLWLQLDRGIGPEWRVELDGRAREVVEVEHLESRLGTPEHTKITVR